MSKASFLLSKVKKPILWEVAWMLVVAMLTNGWVAALEDDLPAGFSKPDGSSTPRYAIVTGWISRVVGDVAIVACAAVIWVGLSGR